MNVLLIENVEFHEDLRMREHVCFSEAKTLQGERIASSNILRQSGS